MHGKQLYQQTRLGVRIFLLLLFLVALWTCACFIVDLMRNKMFISDSKTDLLPFNQLNRAHMSRDKTLDLLKRVVIRVNKEHGRPNPFRSHLPDSSLLEDAIFYDYIKNDAHIIEAMGFTSLAQEVKGSTREEILPLNTNSPKEVPKWTAEIINGTFCYPNTFTPQEPNRKVDPSFCPRLLQLLDDIQNGLQPPLLTLFTWLPDPIADVEKMSRRIIFRNWNLLRPFVQPVVFSDYRLNMGLSNSVDWPCPPVPAYDPDGMPIFRNMSDMVSASFRSTFYGYVESTTIFDASLLETLMSIKEYFLRPGKPDSSNKQSPVLETGVLPLVEPVLIYGKALNSCNLGFYTTLQQVGERARYKQDSNFVDSKDAMVYFIYSGFDFQDIPDIVVEDKFLTPFVYSKSSILGHVLIDTSNTVLALHNTRDRATSEWDRYYVKPNPRDLNRNKRLAAMYLNSLSQKTTQKPRAKMVTSIFDIFSSVSFNVMATAPN